MDHVESQAIVAGTGKDVAIKFESQCYLLAGQNRLRKSCAWVVVSECGAVAIQQMVGQDNREMAVRCSKGWSLG